MRTCARIAVLALALAQAFASLPEPAAAHGTMTPNRAAAGTTQRFVVRVPNESVNVLMTEYALTPPDGVSIEAVDVEPAFSISRRGDTVVWTGDVQPGATGTFAFSAGLPDSARSLTFHGEESYTNLPNTGLFPFVVALDPRPASANGSGTPVRAGAAVAAALILVLSTLGVVALRRRRR